MGAESNGVTYLEPDHSVFVIPTRDLAASMSFYRDGLGLEVLEEWSEMGRGALLRLAVNVEVELLELEGLQPQAEPRIGIGPEIADERVDEVYERLVELGFEVKGLTAYTSVGQARIRRHSGRCRT